MTDQLKLSDRTELLPVKGLGLDKHVERLGGKIIAIKGAHWTDGVKYRLTDKHGALVAVQLSTAWHWVCDQYGIPREGATA